MSSLPSARAAALAVVVFVSGCSSRWALSDPEYAAKYGGPYTGDRVEKVERMAKQSVDARFMDGRAGAYGGVASSSDPTTAGAEVGLFVYPTSWLEGRVSYAGLFGTGAETIVHGANVGARLQTPSRIAPFVGAGAFGGFARVERDELLTNLVDDDDDGTIDNVGEEVDWTTFLALYPELGVHFWVTPRTRLTGSASYYFTTEGRDSDFWFVGVSIAHTFVH